jgi:ABC-type multidrug transport system fused ATPase/permease subunit
VFALVDRVSAADPLADWVVEADLRTGEVLPPRRRAACAHPDEAGTLTADPAAAGVSATTCEPTGVAELTAVTVSGVGLTVSADSACHWHPGLAGAPRGVSAAHRGPAPADLDQQHAAAASAAEAEAVPAAIEFRDVSFRYPLRPQRRVLRGFSLRVPRGAFVGITGTSGAGKSTLALLLERFYDAEGGSVLVGGVDVQRWDVGDLRDEMSLAAQDTALFSDTVAYNVAYGRRGLDKLQHRAGASTTTAGAAAITQAADHSSPTPQLEAPSSGGADLNTTSGAPAAPADVVSAVEAACASQFVSDLKSGYETQLGGAATAGSQISGGQRQRLGLARALVRVWPGGAPILLLDEATASLDNETEAAVMASLMQALGRSRGGRPAGDGPQADGGSLAGAQQQPTQRHAAVTVLVVAHRLSLVRACDSIVVVDGGRAAEEGTHEQLMARRGRYHALATAQGITE